MMTRPFISVPLCLAGLLVLLPAAVADPINLAAAAKVRASSEHETYPARFAVDGVVSDASRWLAAAGEEISFLELEFPAPVDIGAVDLYSGWEDQPGLAEIEVDVRGDGKWLDTPAGKVSGNRENHRRLRIEAKGVTGLRLKLGAGELGKIRELAVYADAATPPGTGLSGDRLPPRALPRDAHLIALNQVGFETARPKRFTAPLSPDGSAFLVRPAGGGGALFRGTIRSGIGDFSGFRPEASAGRFVVEISGTPLATGVSDPFLIRPNLWQEQFWQPAVDFLIDTRSVTGTHPSAFGGCPWRDGNYYDAILPSLVLFHLSDPARIAAMPRQIDWEADKRRVLDPAFRFDPKNPESQGVMEAVRRYYTELEAPAPDAPDVVKLLHWGAGFYLMKPETKDPMGDPEPRQIHAQTVEQIAYLVWAWPAFEKWLPASFYERCRDFCFAHWDKSLAIDKWWDPAGYDAPPEGENPMAGRLHPYKGRHAPGHSIVPNLLMHEIATREGRSDAARYLAAAIAQAAYIVEKIDWTDPRATKGHRMSEHRTIPNLVWLLESHPAAAPSGLKEKIAAWAEVAVRRSDNLWDFRRYDEQEHWTIPKLNDVGNWLSTPAIALAASRVIDDPALKSRMLELAVSHADFVFGRSPRLAAAPHLPAMGFPEIERGWPVGHKLDVCARLELCRGSISSGPGSEMFPFQPEARFRHAEGWVNYGAAWCISLAYFQFESTSLPPARALPR